MGFLRLSATINPHFNRAGSCLFFFPGSSSASFHTFLAPPRLSFLHLSSSSSLRLFFDGFFVRSCHVCVHRCCFKPPLYSSPRHFLRPRFLSAVRGVLLPMHGDTGLHILPTPSEALVSRCRKSGSSQTAHGSVWGFLRATQGQQK